MNTKCPQCGEPVEFEKSRLGLLEKCAKCGEIFELKEGGKGPIAPPKASKPVIKQPAQTEWYVLEGIAGVVMAGMVIATLVSVFVGLSMLAFLLLGIAALLTLLIMQVGEAARNLARIEFQQRKGSPLSTHRTGDTAASKQ